MNRHFALGTVAALMLASLSACSGDDSTTNAPNDAGPDGTTDASFTDTGTGTGDASSADDSASDASPTDGGADAGSPDATADGAAVDASSDTGADAGPTCAVTNSAATITTMSTDAGSLPVQSGTTLVSGTYALTAYAWYGGTETCDGAPLKDTLVVDATSATTGTLSEIEESPGSSGTPSCNVGISYETSGNHFIGADGGAAGATTFTATSTTIVLALPDNGSCGSALRTYTKM